MPGFWDNVPVPNFLQPGDRFAGTQIVRLLGRGGQAEVYEGITPVGVRHAIKLLGADDDLASKPHARLVEECEALARVEHVNIVHYFRAGIERGRVFLVMELVDGRSLQQRLAPGEGLIPLEVFVRWIRDACEGMAAAHRRGIVHRDLKPSNILITNGEPEVVKVIDFGIAKMTGSGVRTTTANPQGTALYMAPEQLQKAPADPRMDIYSMGLLLYKGIAGVHPMGDAPRTLIDVVAWHLTQLPRPLREVAPEVPLDIEELVHRCLEKDPAKRVQTMRDLADGLDAALVRLLVPRVRSARNVPVPGRPAPLAPTHAMAAVSGPGSAPEVSSQKPSTSPQSSAMPVSSSASAPSGTAIMTSIVAPTGYTDPVSAPASGQRVALGGTAIMSSISTPDVPTQRSPQPLRTTADVPPPPREDRAALLPLAATAPLVPSTLTQPRQPARGSTADAPSRESALTERRTTGTPVQSSVTPELPRRRTLPVALALGGVALLSAVGWLFIGRPPTPSHAAQPSNAAAGAMATPAPVPTPSGSAVAPPASASSSALARPSPRRARPAPAPRHAGAPPAAPRARGRMFGD